MGKRDRDEREGTYLRSGRRRLSSLPIAGEKVACENIDESGKATAFILKMMWHGTWTGQMVKI